MCNILLALSVIQEYLCCSITGATPVYELSTAVDYVPVLWRHGSGWECAGWCSWSVEGAFRTWEHLWIQNSTMRFMWTVSHAQGDGHPCHCGAPKELIGYMTRRCHFKLLFRFEWMNLVWWFLWNIGKLHALLYFWLCLNILLAKGEWWYCCICCVQQVLFCYEKLDINCLQIYIVYVTCCVFSEHGHKSIAACVF